MFHAPSAGQVSCCAQTHCSVRPAPKCNFGTTDKASGGINTLDNRPLIGPFPRGILNAVAKRAAARPDGFLQQEWLTMCNTAGSSPGQGRGCAARTRSRATLPHETLIVRAEKLGSFLRYRRNGQEERAAARRRPGARCVLAYSARSGSAGTAAAALTWPPCVQRRVLLLSKEVHAAGSCALACTPSLECARAPVRGRAHAPPAAPPRQAPPSSWPRRPPRRRSTATPSKRSSRRSGGEDVGRPTRAGARASACRLASGP
jgi:hypothetical protein